MPKGCQRYYLPILPGPYGKDTDKSDVWIAETPISCLRRAEVVFDIERWQVDLAPVRVLEIDEDAGTVKDVTAEIASEVGDPTFGNITEPFPELRSWLDDHHAGYYQYAGEPSASQAHGTAPGERRCDL